MWVLGLLEQDCHDHELPSKANKFESFFTQLYTVTLASSGELICKDFFLYTEKNQFGIFATSTAQIHDAPAVGGAIQGIPSIEKITFHLVRLEDGVILDERVFCNDYINLAHSMGVFLYDDLMAIVSLRYQRIHILQIRDSGNLVDVRSIGEYCREDDELFLNSSAQASEKRDLFMAQKKLEAVDNRDRYTSDCSFNGCECMSNPDRNRTHNIENGLDHNQHTPEAPFLGGLKQRLLSFIFRGIWNEEDDPTVVQFLDRHHLLIKFGSVDGGVARNTDNHPAFFAVYNMETTEIISFYQNSADELYTLFELFCDHFHSSSKNSFYMNFLSTHSNNIHALEQLRCNKNKASSLPQLISSTDRHRQSTDHPIKFISRRQPNILKFKIKPGPESGSADTRTKKRSLRFYSIQFCL
ncbi:hypothetical protein DH2020_039574 [Rehmannia glutinosa]|uniref:Light-mediated development protein DET1 n=1 Tax=Rehmannia glutinosa TaxID=99300 RepID=A0ABR0UVE9_REHGL